MPASKVGSQRKNAASANKARYVFLNHPAHHHLAVPPLSVFNYNYNIVFLPFLTIEFVNFFISPFFTHFRPECIPLFPLSTTAVSN